MHTAYYSVKTNSVLIPRKVIFALFLSCQFFHRTSNFEKIGVISLFLIKVMESASNFSPLAIEPGVDVIKVQHMGQSTERLNLKL